MVSYNERIINLWNLWKFPIKSFSKHMKKYCVILLMLIAVVAAPMSNAQLRYGIKLGANVSNTCADFHDIKLDGTALTNFTGGVTVEWIVAGGFGLDASAMYTAKGATYTFGDNLGGLLGNLADRVLENKVHYIEVPVNLKYKLQIPAVERVIAPYLYLGPSFAFKVGESIELGDKSISSKEIENSSIDYAFNLGLGMEIINHINLSVQYGWGLNSSSEFNFLDKIIDETSVKSGAWTITVGWMF